MTDNQELHPSDTHPQPRLLIVTDLDGTLLDHHSYSFSAALPALARAAAAAIPVIPNTSKTRAELLALRRALGNDDPFVVENGSAICLPAAFRPQLDSTRSDSDGLIELRLGVELEQIHAVLAPLRERFDFSCFSDWTLEALIAHTGLSPAAAQAARERRYSEALLWRDDATAKAAFIARLDSAGLHALQGGRFLSVLGAEADKGRALQRLRELYTQRWGSAPCVIALGDSGNDVAMLEAADIAVVIANPHHPPPTVAAPEVIYSRQPGPAGWNETIQALLDRLGVPG